ncbi:hypothetical protein evm_001726 [Chilo suppressalis]|nr:hypothetical protein evm_001726 [Chilo suppressalis]
MDSELDIQNFLNCTQHILDNEKWAHLNITQLLDLLPSQIVEDIDLKVTLGNCMGLGVRPYSPPWWGQLAWFIVFAMMLLLAILGNTLVIWIVLAHRRMRTVTNCFLVNLAVADLLMATLNGAPNFVFLVTAHWPFGAATCTASNFTANLTVSAGVFTLVAITVDRYVAIVKPLQHRLSRRVARTALFTVWCASALLALPSLLYSDTYKKQAQYGFTKNRCTTDAGATMLKYIFNALEKSQNALGVICDLSKVFDCGNHQTLLRKLNHYGIKDSAQKSVQSYLTERTQIVDINGTKLAGCQMTPR